LVAGVGQVKAHEDEKVGAGVGSDSAWVQGVDSDIVLEKLF